VSLGQTARHRAGVAASGQSAALFSDFLLSAFQISAIASHPRQIIFRLLVAQFGAMIGKTMNGRHFTPTARQVTVEVWLRSQGPTTVRQNQKPNVSTSFPKIWSQI